MVSSYARIRLNVEQAMDRFSHWVGFTPLRPPRSVPSSQVVSSATECGKWIGKVVVLIFEVDGWAVFKDLTGYLDSVAAERWLEFAQRDELVFAGYNESIHYGQLIVIQNGAIVRNFLDDRQDPSDNKNLGNLPFEDDQPIESWVDAAYFVDVDKLAPPHDEAGLLWMFGEVESSSVVGER